VVNFLYHNIVMEYGSPSEIITDRAKNFIEGALKVYENAIKVRHKATTPYHARTNGMVERIHRTLNHALSTLTFDNPQRWNDFLPAVIFGMRARTHSTTRKSAFYLCHGIEPRTPIDPTPPRAIMQPLTEQEEEELKIQENAELLEQLGFHRKEAYQKSLELMQKMKKRKGNTQKRKISRNENVTQESTSEEDSSHKFSIGDRVLRRNYRATKFSKKWLGPYLVTSLGFPGTYWLTNLETAEPIPNTINENDLTLWKKQPLKIHQVLGENHGEGKSNPEKGNGVNTVGIFDAHS
jgi:hypothetical protein